MKEQLEELVRSAVAALINEGEITAPGDTAVQLERTRDERHGNFSTNFAMAAAKSVQRNPRDLARKIVERLPPSDVVERVEIAGPGFINFFLRRKAYLEVIPRILSEGEAYGRSRSGAGTPILLEFVSANPTGPLHIGHGRGAAYGAALGNLLAASGYRVTREYYVNDAGRQMDILALSVWLRYLEQCGQEISFPEGAYRGAYIRDISGALLAEAGRELELPAVRLFEGLDADLDIDARLDELITRATRALGTTSFDRVRSFGLARILDDIRDDLSEFGVDYDVWYSEHSLMDGGKVDNCLEVLKSKAALFEQDGATWFRSSAWGDEKDRVVIRENGQKTYFAADIAYHLDKFERGFSRAINVWGADHHGHAARMKAALAALGHDPDALEVLLVQFATLYRGGRKVQMSTRSGEFVTLRELRAEIGNDAARFFYVTRKSEQHLDFDLDLAKSESSDNPVYYIQYAHARICSVLYQMEEKGFAFDRADALLDIERLDEPHELALLNTLSRYPEVIDGAAAARDPHLVAFYLREVANDFHAYYNTHQFLVEDSGLRNARLCLVLAVRQVVRNGLSILGVSAPESM